MSHMQSAAMYYLLGRSQVWNGSVMKDTKFEFSLPWSYIMACIKLYHKVEFSLP